MNADVSSVLEILVGAGFFTALSEAVRRIFGRRRAKIDNAEVIQGMALSMLEPLQRRLEQADRDVDDLTQKVHTLTEQLDHAIKRAEAAEAVLSANNLPIPIRRVL